MPRLLSRRVPFDHPAPIKGHELVEPSQARRIELVFPRIGKQAAQLLLQIGRQGRVAERQQLVIGHGLNIRLRDGLADPIDDGILEPAISRCSHRAPARQFIREFDGESLAHEDGPSRSQILRRTTAYRATWPGRPKARSILTDCIIPRVLGRGYQRSRSMAGSRRRPETVVSCRLCLCVSCPFGMLDGFVPSTPPTSSAG